MATASKKVAFGMRSDPLALGTDYEIKGGGEGVQGDREIFRDRTGTPYDEEHYGDQTTDNPEYLVHKTATAHLAWTRGQTVNGWVLDDWKLSSGNQAGQKLSVNIHKPF